MASVQCKQFGYTEKRFFSTVQTKLCPHYNLCSWWFSTEALVSVLLGSLQTTSTVCTAYNFLLCLTSCTRSIIVQCRLKVHPLSETCWFQGLRSEVCVLPLCLTSSARSIIVQCRWKVHPLSETCWFQGLRSEVCVLPLPCTSLWCVVYVSWRG